MLELPTEEGLQLPRETRVRELDRDVVVGRIGDRVGVSQLGDRGRVGVPDVYAVVSVVGADRVEGAVGHICDAERASTGIDLT